jgi:opacity protein-like surface antigen
MYQIHAQTVKGSIFIGGSSSLDLSFLNYKWKTDSGSGDDGKTTSLEFNGQIGYFVFKNCVLGLEIPYTYSKEIDRNETNDYSYLTTTVNLIPFLRYYIGNSKFKPYFHGGIGPGWGFDKYFDSSNNEKKIPLNIFAYEIGGGLGFFVNEHLSIDIGILYGSASIKWRDTSANMDRSSIASGVGSTIGIVMCF